MPAIKCAHCNGPIGMVHLYDGAEVKVLCADCFKTHLLVVQPRISPDDLDSEKARARWSETLPMWFSPMHPMDPLPPHYTTITCEAGMNTNDLAPSKSVEQQLREFRSGNISTNSS